MTATLQQELRTKWDDLLRACGATQNQFRVFQCLVDCYSAPDRHYHNLNHLAEVLRIVDDLANCAADPNAVRLAAWFHDAVYDSRASNNEERSAQLATESLAEMGIERLAGPVSGLILSTKTHVASGPDAAVLLDADLAILGAESHRYDEYAHRIREEYCWVTDEAYREGRARILEQFLIRQSIFATEQMRRTLETAARANVARELARLRS